jgi:protein-disulfide isomerase
MSRFRLAIVLAGALLLCWQLRAATALPGVDLSGLTPGQTTLVLKILETHDCGCGCGYKIAECREKDSACSYSKGLAKTIVEAIKSGKTEAEAIAAADKSQWAHQAAQDTRILSDAVKIPTEGSPVLGPANAPIKLVEFSDFQCPYCIMATPQIEALLKAYGGQISLTFKQFPLDMHSQAAGAAAAALAAQMQGKFWPMHDALFAQQGHLSPQVILQIAGKIGLSLIRFQADMNSDEVKKTVARDLEDGENAGVTGTPTLFVNGQRYNGPVKVEALKPIIDAELKLPAKAAATASLGKPSGSQIR